MSRQPSWLLLCPSTAYVKNVDLGWRSVENVPSGASVALADDRWGSRRRLRRLASRGHVTIDRELIVLPSLDRSLVVIDDTRESVRHFWDCVATVPPGLAWTALPAWLVLHTGRRLPWTWTGLAPARVVVGRRR